jgi:hypothetical protein
VFACLSRFRLEFGDIFELPRYESYSLRLDELLIKDMKFLHGQDMPTLAVLYEDNKQKRHVKTYVINLKDKELVKGPWSQPNVESGASLLHSLPRLFPKPAYSTCKPHSVTNVNAGACGGVLVFGDQSIAHLKGDPKVLQPAAAVPEAYTQTKHSSRNYSDVLWPVSLKSFTGSSSAFVDEALRR